MRLHPCHAAVLALLASPCAVGGDSVAPAQGERLVVFVNPASTPLATAFTNDELRKIRSLAGQMNLPIRVIDVRRGAPPEIALTPLIVFQNHRGRSIYQGRYTSIDRIRTFVRTARAVSQSADSLTLKNAPVWTAGRARVAAAIKVAAVTGTTPERHEHEPFAAKAAKTIASALQRFRPTDSIDLRRTDRRFYMDFNPWRSDDGTLYLSVALFSQFHCKKPIYKHDDRPFVGPWDQRDRLFREAAEAMERAVVAAMTAAHSGDGFEPIGTDVPTVSWASLGLALPPRPAGEKPTRSAAALPLRWRVVENAAEPMILFRFAPPLDSYAGEATRVSGTLTLGPNRELGRMRGGFEVATDSVTMGEPDLDDALRGAVFLHAERHPTAGFTIDGVTTDVAKLAYNQPARVTLTGTFKMKGVAIPLNVRAQLEPFVDADGSPALTLTASFQLDLRAFDIEGADGPAPANHTLLFDVSLELAPAEPHRK